MEHENNLNSEENQVEFTRHVLERYVERTMNKTGLEIKQYLAQNEDIVKERILKLYNSSEPFFAEKTKKHDFTYFRINKNGWLFVIDKNGAKIVTLYKIDLGLGEEFNKKYVEEIKKTVKENVDFIETEKENLKKAKMEMDNEIEELKKENTLLDSHIQANTDKIKILEETNKNNVKKLEIKNEEFKRKIERFVGTKIF